MLFRSCVRVGIGCALSHSVLCLFVWAVIGCALSHTEACVCVVCFAVLCSTFLSGCPEERQRNARPINQSQMWLEAWSQWRSLSCPGPLILSLTVCLCLGAPATRLRAGGEPGGAHTHTVHNRARPVYRRADIIGRYIGIGIYNGRYMNIKV